MKLSEHSEYLRFHLRLSLSENGQMSNLSQSKNNFFSEYGARSLEGVRILNVFFVKEM